MSRQKAFGIGFHKTGTTTLSRAQRILGYEVAGPFGVQEENISKTALERALATAADYYDVQDKPLPLFYLELGDAYPGSKFILTIRDTDRLLASVVNHFGGKSTPMRRWIYGPGDPIGNEELYVERYERHNAEVAEYFAERPGELLVLDIAAGDGWDKLCSFLGTSVPNEPFPHPNARGERRIFKILQRRARRVFSRREGLRSSIQPSASPGSLRVDCGPQLPAHPATMPHGRCPADR